MGCARGRMGGLLSPLEFIPGTWGPTPPTWKRLSVPMAVQKGRVTVGGRLDAGGPQPREGVGGALPPSTWEGTLSCRIYLGARLLPHLEVSGFRFTKGQPRGGGGQSERRPAGQRPRAASGEVRTPEAGLGPCRPPRLSLWIPVFAADRSHGESSKPGLSHPFPCGHCWTSEKPPAQGSRAPGEEGAHLMPELQLKMLPFSISGKLRAEIGEFSSSSLHDPSVLWHH